jgi:hypothetical protein
MVDLPNNVLNPLKLFLGYGERFHEITITENGGGKARKINGRTTMANQERDVWKELKQKYLQKENAIK